MRKLIHELVEAIVLPVTHKARLRLKGAVRSTRWFSCFSCRAECA